MPNIKFSYLYRDAGNYKNYGHIVFANPNKLSLEQVLELIKQRLIDGTWFYAKEWGLPDLHFDRWDEELDHGFHEFEGGSLLRKELLQIIAWTNFWKLSRKQAFLFSLNKPINLLV